MLALADGNMYIPQELSKIMAESRRPTERRFHAFHRQMEISGPHQPFVHKNESGSKTTATTIP